MSSKSHAGFWILSFIIAVFVVPYFVRSDQMRDRLLHEVEQVRTVLGESIGGEVLKVAAGAYNATVVDSGARAGLDSMRHTDKDKRAAKKAGTAILEAAATAFDSYVDALSMQLYAIILRATIVLTWLLLLAPFGIAVLVDGFYARAKKFETLGFQNPTAFAVGTHVAVFISALPLMYIVVPITVSPMFFPWWAVMTAIPLSFAIQHMQPVLTR